MMALKKTMVVKVLVAFLLLYLPFLPSLKAQVTNSAKKDDIVSASWIRDHVTTNPVTPSWLKSHLKKQTPRLLLTSESLLEVEQKLKGDTLIGTYCKYLHHYADEICLKPIVKERLIGPRVPAIGEVVQRIEILAFVYRITHNSKYLDRLNKALNVASDFTKWDSIQFLGHATMSYGLAVGVDWVGKWLPDSTVEKARTAIKKQLESALQSKQWWEQAPNNWNQVCHSGLSAGALVLADQYPKLAAGVIKRAVYDLPYELAEYSPDGAYPEGPSYWGYGTSFNLMAISFFQSALGTDFNLPESPGFIKSAIYRMEVVGPSGESFNYSDAGTGGLNLSIRGDLAWFAQYTGNSLYLNKKEFLLLIHDAMKRNAAPPMFAPLQLVWLAEFKENKSELLPTDWKGEGYNPIAVFRGDKDDSHHFYLGAKGGRGSLNHGNMDAGSFIFELNGVRWVIDPGTQDYHDLEKTGLNLWCKDQNCQRWTLLTKNNFGHSALTVNHTLFNVDGFVPIVEFKEGVQPEVTFDMSGLYFNNLKNVSRQFVKENDDSLLIKDKFEVTSLTKMITWQLLTTANVGIVKGGAILQKDGKQLKLQILSPSNITVSVVSLNPPPLKLDKRIENLKRIELHVPAWTVENGVGVIEVRLSGG